MTTPLHQAIDMIERQDLSHWSNDHDRAVLAVLRREVAQPPASLTSPHTSPGGPGQAVPMPASAAVNQSLTTEQPSLMDIRTLWGQSTEATGGDGLEAMRHFARLVLARYGMQPAASVEPLPVFSKGPWLFRETGEEFTGADLDAAAFAAYRAAQAPAMPDEVRASLMDSQYLAGVTAGWNAAQADDPNAALKKIEDAYAGYLKPLRDWQKAGRPGAVQAPAAAGDALPWDDCKIAYGVDDEEPLWAAWQAGTMALPAGWSLNETDGAGARMVTVFRVEVLPTAQDGQRVRDAIDAAMQRTRDGGAK